MASSVAQLNIGVSMSQQINAQRCPQSAGGGSENVYSGGVTAFEIGAESGWLAYVVGPELGDEIVWSVEGPAEIVGLSDGLTGNVAFLTEGGDPNDVQIHVDVNGARVF